MKTVTLDTLRILERLNAHMRRLSPILTARVSGWVPRPKVSPEVWTNDINTMVGAIGCLPNASGDDDTVDLALFIKYSEHWVKFSAEVTAEDGRAVHTMIPEHVVATHGDATELLLELADRALRICLEDLAVLDDMLAAIAALRPPLS